MLWLRGVLFSVLLPGTLAVWLPRLILGERAQAGGFYLLGWLLVCAGALLYFACLLQFLNAGGTPAIYFTRTFRWLVGQEPQSLISNGPYGFSRNPMYVAVTAAVTGQAIAYKSLMLCSYAAILFLCFHATVVWLEEPHLQRKQGRSFEEYCRKVPRWL